jgi:hypothetical protein
MEFVDEIPEEEEEPENELVKAIDRLTQEVRELKELLRQRMQ